MELSLAKLSHIVVILAIGYITGFSSHDRIAGWLHSNSKQPKFTVETPLHSSTTRATTVVNGPDHPEAKASK